MGDFHGDRECVTHHFACDCREAAFRELYAGVRVLVNRTRAADFSPAQAAAWHRAQKALLDAGSALSTSEEE